MLIIIVGKNEVGDEACRNFLANEFVDYRDYDYSKVNVNTNWVR